MTCPKSNMTVTNNFNLPKISKVAKVTCTKSVKVTSNLLDFYVNPETWFHDWRKHHESLENYLKPHFNRMLSVSFKNLISNKNLTA